MPDPKDTSDQRSATARAHRRIAMSRLMRLKRPHPTAKTGRRAAIFARWQQVDNLAAVGREYGITRERVRQIVKAMTRSPDP
jgi:DNA-directed RNA polymerase sigma subunit (sigma70/sigma32)